MRKPPKSSLQNPHPRRRPAGRRTRPTGTKTLFRALLRRLTGLSFVQVAAFAFALVGIFAALDLTLRDSGTMRQVGWIPAPIARWADNHGQFRNLPAFFFLCLPFQALFTRRRHRIIVTGVLAAFAAVLELAQILLPHRWVEWQDVALSWAGLLLAWILFELIQGAAKRWSIRRRRNQPPVRNALVSSSIAP